MRLVKTLGNRAMTWGAVMAMVACATAALAAETQQGFAKVRYVSGQVTLLKAGGQSQAVEQNMFLRAGDTVKTGPNSHVDLWLANNNGDVHIEPNSTLVLDKLSYTYTGFEMIHDTQFNLQAGAVAGKVNRMATGSKYEVKTPRGVAGIRGTQYRIVATGDTTVTEGTVVQSMVMADGSIKTFTIPSGHSLVGATGEVRAATYDEIKVTNDAINDAMHHGGGSGPATAEDLKFFRESQVEPYVSPIQPSDAGAR
jgi:hypothetical protein